MGSFILESIRKSRRPEHQPRREPTLTGRPPVVLKAPPVLEELLEDTKLRSTSGPGRWLSSSTVPGSVVALSSLRTMSSQLHTVLMELHTLTSWPVLIT